MTEKAKKKKGQYDQARDCWTRVNLGQTFSRCSQVGLLAVG